MFARKVKSADLNSSLQRFVDLHRECSSRVKHLRLILEALCMQEKRQFIEDYSFETFHLVDDLLLQADLTQFGQSVLEIESALWTLEQILCYVPELVGNGWQKNAIESILRKALFPHNLLALRKIAIRLFLLWYQCLALYGNTNLQLDSVFQCLLPHFPLRSKKSTETLLHNYCQSMPFLSGPGPIRNAPLVSDSIDTLPTAKEKAQILQIYMDKFLEYCSRETVRIEWNDDGKRYDCAKFILDRVIVLYIYEIFPDIETNGVDVFGGWEGLDGKGDIRDTADPVIISQYWLIRWMSSIASSSTNEPCSGHQYYHHALMSSRKATNTLLTLLKEAVVLPLPCSNVIHKVFNVIQNWLLQRYLPQFVNTTNISIESFSLLLVHFLMSFFHSPYLSSCGDRLSAAVSLTNALLQTVRELSNPSTKLTTALSANVWDDMIRNLASGIRTVTSRSDAYGRVMSGTLTQNLLCLIVIIRAIRGIELDDRIWDEILSVFQMGCWMSMIEQWSRVAEAVTRALVLNAFNFDIAISNSLQPIVSVRPEKFEEAPSKYEDNDSIEIGSDDCKSENDVNIEDDNVYLNSIVQTTGNVHVWLRIWMRIINLVSPLHAAHSQIAVQTISKIINSLLRVSGTDQLIHWICGRLLLISPSVQATCAPALCSVLNLSNPPPSIQAHILLALNKIYGLNKGISVLEQVPSMSQQHLVILAQPTLSCLSQLVKQLNYSPRSVQVAALLSPDHAAAESLLLNVVGLMSPEVNIQARTLALNALALLIIERADIKLMTEVMNRLSNKRDRNQLVYLFCSNLNQLLRLGQHDKLISLYENSLPLMNDDRLIGEILWRSVEVTLHSGQLNRYVLKRISNENRFCLEGLLLKYCRQFPLPSFSSSQWNSLENSKSSSQLSSSSDVLVTKRLFIDHNVAILSVDQEDGLRITSRTPVGKHCWKLDREKLLRKKSGNINNWLRKLASRPKEVFNRKASNAKEIDDSFMKFPQLPRTGNSDIVDCGDTYSFIQQNRRIPFARKNSSIEKLNSSILKGIIAESALDNYKNFSSSRSGAKKSEIHKELPLIVRSNRNSVSSSLSAESQIDFSTGRKQSLWRLLSSDLQLIEYVRNIPINYARDLRHLDNTSSRELHKVAIIYVARGQEEKSTILMNSSASNSFNKFISGLGWPVQMSKHYGYSGGLAGDMWAPYYSSGDTELIFHVSTWLEGDVTQKLKHLGNDEVHVVWSEHDRPYRRETIMTRFCDILIVLYQMSPVLVKVNIETQKPLEFGPLFDGAHVHVIQLPYLVRDTVINASRAYRLAEKGCIRPLEHREKVFNDVRSQMMPILMSESISQTFMPCLKS